MVDTPTLRNRLRKQELGTNTNTWGDDKLNEVIDAIDQALDGVEAIALTGDKVLSSSNYTLADESLNRVLKFTGTLSAAAVVTLPSVEHWYLIVNDAGAQVTVKTAAGNGVDVANGGTALVYCDGADVLNGAPTTVGSAMTVAGALSVAGTLGVSGKISGVTAGTSATDAINKTQLDTAIAGATVAGVTGTVKVDATAGARFLIDALTASGSVTLTDNGDSIAIGAESGIQLTEDAVVKVSDFSVVSKSMYLVDTTGGNITATLPSAPAVGDHIKLDKFGSGVLTLSFNGLKYRGATLDRASSAKGSTLLRYTGTADGWID